MTNKANLEWFEEYLAEGIHTAFRKASDSNRSDQIHQLIAKMPPDEWKSIVSFISSGMIDGMKRRGMLNEK